MSSSWSPSDILHLQQAYTQGLSLKALSLRFGRSPTALNKALSRFQIRKPREPKLSTPPRPRPPRQMTLPRPREKIFCRRFNMVSLEQIMDYLNHQGYCAQSRRFLLNKQLHPFYLVNQRPSSPIHLLVLANSLRLQQHLPIFALSEEAKTYYEKR